MGGYWVVESVLGGDFRVFRLAWPEPSKRRGR